MTAQSQPDVNDGEGAGAFEFVLRSLEPFTGVDCVADVLEDAPGGLGPLIGRVFVDPSSSETDEVAAGSLDVDADSVFRLFLDGDDGGVAVSGGAQVLPVAALAELGSPMLRAALKAASFADVLEALAFDMVVVPVVPEDDGLATRLFVLGSDEPDEPGERCLCVFSSAKTLGRFLGDDPQRCFVVRQGAGLIEFLGRHVDAVQWLVFDAGESSVMCVGASAITDLLQVVPVDDDVLEELAAVEELSGFAVSGFDLGLDAQWGKIDVTPGKKREGQIKRLVAAQTKKLGDQAAGLRREMRSWLGSAADRASESGGLQMAFLLTHTKQAAAAVSVVTYLHRFSFDVGSASNTDMVAHYLRGRAGPDDELVRIDLGDTEMVRHVRLGHGDPRLGGGEVQLLNIDYWIGAPDHLHVAHVCFSSPHVDAREAITLLADNVVINGGWMFRDDDGLPGEPDVDAVTVGGE